MRARTGSYLRRIEKYCLGFEVAARRGLRRDDVRPALRIVGFERRTTVAFHIETGRVTIDRIFYAGRDLSAAFAHRQK